MLDEAQQFAERIHVRAAKLERLADAVAVTERGNDGLGNVFNVDRRETRVEPRHRQDRRKPEYPCEAVDEGVLGAEDHGRAKDRHCDVVAGKLPDQLFGPPFRAQIVARPAVGVCFQRAHLNESADACLVARVHQLLGELDVRPDETAAVVPALVEYSDQVDNRVASDQKLVERRLVVDITVAKLETGQHEQGLRGLPPARRHANRISGRCQSRTDGSPDETRAAENANQSFALST